MKFKASSHDSVIPAAPMQWKNPCNLNEREKKEEKRLVGMVMIEAKNRYNTIEGLSGVMT